MRLKNDIKKLLLIICLLSSSALQGQTAIFDAGNAKWHVSKNGRAISLIFYNRSGNDTIPFFAKGKKTGPAFYVKQDQKEISAEWNPDGHASYRSEINGVSCRISYTQYRHSPALKIVISNLSPTTFHPEKTGLKLGIDTYMDVYPKWLKKYFPTLMRNESTHFYGYLQSPSGHVLGLVSEQPIASWSVDYNLGYMDPSPYWFMGHRIESLNIDLLNSLPLPDHNPQNLHELKQGESKTWILSFINVGDLNNLETAIRKTANVPMIDLEQTSFIPGESATFKVLGDNPKIKIANDKGMNLPFNVKSKRGEYLVKLKLPDIGLYSVTVKDSDKISRAVLSVRHSWKWIMEKARENAWHYHQKPTSHAESWYGFYSAFLAAKYFPNKHLDKKLSDYFDELYGKLHDTIKVEPLYYKSRIQNTSTTIGLLVSRYEATDNESDLHRASLLADWLIKTSQREDGAYYNHGTIYTSVIYVAKSILELSKAENSAGGKWIEASKRHYDSAKRAIDQLVASQGNFQTEGQLTFEDGMISCSALQIGMLATMQTDEKLRRHYTDAMLKILKNHSCLTQLRVPDARRRGGTMRFWEAQYDVQMLPNMFNSPHGWSAWRGYATYYAYLLTGSEHWLRETFNAMGAFANLIDYKNGQLRWAFIVDPYLRVEQSCSADSTISFSDLSFGNPHPKLYKTRQFIIGEQYINMISDWQTINTQDNDVHEVFKCIGETVLTNAFVIERSDGTIAGYNCSVKKSKNILQVKSLEQQITNLHLNLSHPYKVFFNGKKIDKS